MSRKREQRLRRRLRAALRELDRDAIDREIAGVARRYVATIENPDPREPWAVATMRDWLVYVVRRARGAVAAIATGRRAA